MLLLLVTSQHLTFSFVMNIKMHDYKYNPPIDSPASQKALEEIRTKLTSPKLQHENFKNLSSLRVHSLKRDYSLHLLTQFYNEQMIPHFPLEDERDSLEDWIYCLDPAQLVNYDDTGIRGPLMDILLLLCDDSNDDDCKQSQGKPVILAGVAFEYYQQAEVGLVSYVTVNHEFRRNGIMSRLHPLAIEALKHFHCYSYHERNACLPEYGIKAIFAETNTVDAGDASREEIMNRHCALYALGYRLLEFPYAQPPLGTDQDSFDDVMLLVYQGSGHSDEHKGGGEWFVSDGSGCVPSEIPLDYIVDFFMSVYGYQSADMESFEHHWYYKLSHWFQKRYPCSTIKKNLPWIDVTNGYRREYEGSMSKVSSNHDTIENVVVVIGAGAAGLSAAVELAKNATSPLLVKLIEANDCVGGRIKTVFTADGSNEQYVNRELADICKAFAPWPLPIGAEFVHGVGSVVNDIIEENDWTAEETFDFCAVDEYPARNSFTVRALTNSLTQVQRKFSLVKIFGSGKCWDLQNPSTGTEDRYGNLIVRAEQVWDEIYAIGDTIMPGQESPIPQDVSLSTFIEQKMKGEPIEDIESVKSIIDAVYCKTAGSSVDHFGVNEACREETSWDYTESNFRTGECFAEFILHYLKEIDRINASYEAGECKGTIELVTSTPIVSIGSSSNGGGRQSKVVLSSRDGSQYTCDKVIVTVPLAVLKAGKINFCDEYSLPVEKKLAIERINMFSGMKAHLLLRKDIDVRSASLLEQTDLFFCPGEIFVQVWLRRDEGSIFLTGFVVADGRELLLSRIKEGETAQDIFLNQLQRMFKDDTGCNLFVGANATCTAFQLHDWSDDEFVMGLYSSPSIDAGWRISGESNGDDLLKTARHDLKAPIGETIYFAGEHANTKTCATVQAAIESGLAAASDVLASLSN